LNGQRRTRDNPKVLAARRSTFLVPALALVAMGMAIALGWGFTVDDALISTRVAHHLSHGVGYRFNPDGDIVDCVTPLGWAWLLAPWASDPWSGLRAARCIGVACALAMALLLGVRCRRVDPGRWLSVATPLAVCLPLGAWASSGMETPFVALLVAIAIVDRRAALWGPALAAGLRPECIPLALVLGITWPVRTRRKRALNVAVAAGPALVVAFVRVSVFGHPAPLSAFAKPSDFGSGVGYAVGGLALLGLPVLLVGLRSYASLSAHGRALFLGSLAHVAAIVLAGGDWMALFRLFVPVLPLWAYLAAELSRAASARAVWAKSIAATCIGLALVWVKGPAARGVWHHRERLIQLARPALAPAFRVASLDVGWVGAATRAPIVDLAGVTDPEVAYLPGGHTSKRLPQDFLVRRDPDTLVLLLAPGVGAAEAMSRPSRELHFARAVEQRVTRLEGADQYAPVTTLPLGGGSQLYLVLRRVGAALGQRTEVWNSGESATLSAPSPGP
jgi:hypothetical protein